jgi:hypothetical protein
MNGTCVMLLCNPSKKNGEKKKSDLFFLILEIWYLWLEPNLILGIDGFFETWISIDEQKNC